MINLMYSLSYKKNIYLILDPKRDGYTFMFYLLIIIF